MKKRYVVICCIFCAIRVHAQLHIKEADLTTHRVEDLVRYWVGKGVAVKNLTYSLNRPAFGSFSFTGTALGVNNGIVLSTGKAVDALGPNNAQYTETRWNTAGDTDIFSMLGNTPNRDAAVIEFDFEPLADTIQFRFVYGSEEYDYQVGQETQSDDTFAAFLSGPNIAGKINIATVSGLQCTGCYVAVSNINNGQALYGTAPSGPPFNAEWYIYNPVNSPITQFNGYTKPIPVKVAVSKCETYHLKLVIADWGNIGWFDSGVFIEPGIFSTSEVGIFSTIPYSTLDNTIAICKKDTKPILSVQTIAGAQYQWYRNDTLLVGLTQIEAATSGLYSVLATVAGCKWQDSVQVNIGDDFELEINTAPTLLCTQDSVRVKGVLKNAVDTTYTNYTWLWSSLPAVPFAENEPAQTWKPTQTTSVTLIVKNEGGCAQSTGVVITVNPVFYTLQLHTQSPADTHVCFQNQILLLSGFQQTGVSSDTLTKTWRIKNQIISTGVNHTTLDVQESGYYVFELVSSAGCKISDSIFIKVDTLTLNRPATLAPCELSSVLVSISGADAYTWRETGNPSFLTTLPSWLYSPISVNSTLTVLAQKRFLPDLVCTTLDTIPVVAKPLPIYTKPNDTTVCVGSKIPINITGATPLWISTMESGNDFDYVVTKTEVLTFITQSADNCSKTDSIVVQALPLPTITLLGKNTWCHQTPMALSAAGASLYMWQYNSMVYSTAELNATATYGQTQVTVTGTSTLTGCSQTQEYTLVIHQNFLQDFISATDTNICPRDRLYPTLAAPMGYDYFWLPFATKEERITANFPTTYILQITDANGCVAVDSIKITQECAVITTPGNAPLPSPPILPETFNIPNIFTPNQDGVNDVFYISDLQPFTQVRIYNRWGTEVFFNDNYTNTWAGESSPDGIYFYQIMYMGKSYTGWLQITR